MTTHADQPGTELEVRPPVGMPTQTEWEALTALSDTLAQSQLIPAPLRRKPGDIAVILLTGRELRLPPMQALNSIHVIEGKPTLSAALMMALILSAGHELRITETTNELCTVDARRRSDEKPTTFTFTMEDATRAGLANKGPWKSYPAAMLRARVITAAARAVFPDVLMGAQYAPEELGAEVDPFTGEVVGKVAEEMISEAEALDYFARIDALEDVYREQLKAQMIDQGLLLGKRSGDSVRVLLPRRRAHELDAALEPLEQWSNRANKTEGEGGATTTPEDPQVSAQSVDDVVADAEVVPNVDQPDPPESRGVPDAEIVPDPMPPEPPASDPGPIPADEQPEPLLGGSGPDEAEPAAFPEGAPAADGVREGEVGEAASSPPAEQPSADHQRRRFAISCKEGDIDEDTRHAIIRWLTDERVSSSTEATFQEMARAITLIKLYNTDHLRIVAGTDGAVVVTAMTGTGTAFLESLER